jgi:hypothetical protein
MLPALLVVGCACSGSALLMDSTCARDCPEVWRAPARMVACRMRWADADADSIMQCTAAAARAHLHEERQAPRGRAGSACRGQHGAQRLSVLLQPALKRQAALGYSGRRQRAHDCAAAGVGANPASGVCGVRRADT